MLRLSARLPHRVRYPASVFRTFSNGSTGRKQNASDQPEELEKMYESFLQEEPTFPAPDPSVALNKFESKLYPENGFQWQDMSKDEMVRLLREVDTLMKLPRSKRKDVVLRKYLLTDPRVILEHPDPYARLHENPHVYRDLWLNEESDTKLSAQDEKRRKLHQDRVAELLEIAAGTQSNRTSDWDDLRQKYREEYMKNLRNRLSSLPKPKADALLRQIETEDPALEHQAEIFARKSLQNLFKTFSPEVVEKIASQAIADKYEGRGRTPPILDGKAEEAIEEAAESREEMDQVKLEIAEIHKKYLPNSSCPLEPSNPLNNVLRPLPETEVELIMKVENDVCLAIYSKIRQLAKQEEFIRREIEASQKRPIVQRYDLIQQLIVRKRNDLSAVEKQIEELTQSSGDSNNPQLQSLHKQMENIESDLSVVRVEARRLQKEPAVKHYVGLRLNLTDVTVKQAHTRSDLEGFKSLIADLYSILDDLEENESKARNLVELEALLEQIERETKDDWSERNALGPINPITVDERVQRAAAISQIIAPHTLSLETPLTPKEQRELHDIRKLRAKMAYNARAVLESTLKKAREDQQFLDPKAKEAIDLLTKQIPDFQYEEPVPKNHSFVDYANADWYSQEMREYADRMRMKIELMYGDDPDNSKAQMIGNLLDLNMAAELDEEESGFGSQQSVQGDSEANEDRGFSSNTQEENPAVDDADETDMGLEEQEENDFAITNKRDLLYKYLSEREEPETHESFLKNELMEDIVEDAGRLEEMDPEAWPYEREDYSVDNRWYRMSDHDPIWSEDWSLRDPKYYHTDQAKQDIEQQFEPDIDALQDEDLMEWNSGKQQLAEDVQRAMYLLHWSDPVTYTPRALSKKFRAPLDHVMMVLRRKAFRHWLHFHPDAYSSWHRGLRKCPDGKVHDWIGFWSVYRSQRKAEIMAANMRSPYERRMLMQELAKSNDASVASIVEKWKDQYRIRELKYEMFGESMLVPSEDAARAELDLAMEEKQGSTPLDQHNKLVRETINELILGKVLSDKLASIPITEELEKTISSVASSITNATSSSTMEFSDAANTLSAATENKVSPASIIPELMRLQKVDELLASGSTLDNLFDQGIVTQEEYQRAYTSMEYALYKKRLSPGSLTYNWVNAPFTEKELNEYAAALPKDRISIAWNQVHSPFRIDNYSHAPSRAAVLEAKLENMLREPMFDLSDKEQALQWVEIWSLKYEAEWEKKFLSNWKKFRMVKMQWSEAEADQEIERLKIGIEKSKLLRQALIQRHKDKEAKWKVLFADVEKYYEENGDESLPTNAEREMSMKFLPRLLAAMDQFRSDDPSFFSAYKLLGKQMEVLSLHKYLFDEKEEERLYLNFMGGKDAELNKKAQELQKYIEEGDFSSQWEECTKTLPIYVEKFAPYFPDMSKEELEKCITATMKCIVADSEQAFAHYDFEQEMGLDKEDDLSDSEADELADVGEASDDEQNYLDLYAEDLPADLREADETADDAVEEFAPEDAPQDPEESDEFEGSEGMDAETLHLKRVADLAKQRELVLSTDETQHLEELEHEVEAARNAERALGLEPTVPSASTLLQAEKGGRALEADAIQHGIGDLLAPEPEDLINNDARRDHMLGGQLDIDSELISEEQKEIEMFKPPNISNMGPGRAAHVLREHMIELMEYGYDIFPDPEVLKSQPEPLRAFVQNLIDEIKEDFVRNYGSEDPTQRIPSRRSRRVAIKLGKPEVPPELKKLPDDIAAERMLQNDFDWQDDPFDLPYTLEMSIEITKDEVAKHSYYTERDLSDVFDERALRFWHEQAPEHTWLPVAEVEVTDEELSEEDLYDVATEKNDYLQKMLDGKANLEGVEEFPTQVDEAEDTFDPNDESPSEEESDWDMEGPLTKEPSNFKLLSYFNPKPCGDNIFSRRPVLLAEDWEVTHLKRKEQAWQDRFKRKTELLEAEEKERYRLNGPLGSTPPPRPAPELVDLRVMPRTRFHTVLTDISELPFARYSVVVRDRDGTLRAPTSKEFTRVRYRERNEHDKFHYVRWPVPDQPKVKAQTS